MRRTCLSAIMAAFLLAAMAAGAVPAAAQGFDLTVIPAKVELELPAGQAADFSIELRNSGTDPLQLRVYAMDFAVTPDNVFLFEEPGHYPYSCANWIEISEESRSLELPVGAAANPVFRMTVPPDAEPGGHYAVLFFQDASPPQPGQGAELTPRIGCQVLLTVPGEIAREGAITGFEVESDYLSLWGSSGGASGWPARDIRYRLAVENTGNVHITVLARIDYRASFGFGSGSVELGTMTILPGTVRYFEGSLPAPPFLGRFKAEATISYGPDQFTFNVEKKASTGFTVIPLLWIVLAIVLALAAWLAIRASRRRRR